MIGETVAHYEILEKMGEGGMGVTRLTQDVEVTQTLGVMGTLAYTSPEQASGEIIDARSDIWALGICLYEMLAGKHPFAGNTQQSMISSIRNKNPDPITTFVPQIAHEFGGNSFHEFTKGCRLRVGRAAPAGARPELCIPQKSICLLRYSRISRCA
jgi:serine/threonine protein kinase